MAIKILLQSTIPFTEDDWHIGRFSLIREFLSKETDAEGNRLFDVSARDVEKDPDGNDRVLPRLEETDFDEIWIFAADTGEGLSEADRKGITRFQQRGGGILLTRDHQDLGSCICDIGNVGSAHIFHSKQQDSDETRRAIDDNITTSISFPNYHSGANGDFQTIIATEPTHELLKNSNGGHIEKFPAHPHEGDVSVPPKATAARIIAKGKSKLSGREFNLAIAFEREEKNGNLLGRAVAESSFHHFCDYNWDTSKGCPSFVEEKPGDGYRKNPEALNDIKQYVKNVALWLADRQAN